MAKTREALHAVARNKTRNKYVKLRTKFPIGCSVNDKKLWGIFWPHAVYLACCRRAMWRTTRRAWLLPRACSVADAGDKTYTGLTLRRADSHWRELVTSCDNVTTPASSPAQWLFVRHCSQTDVARETHYRSGQIEICHASSSARLSVIDAATVRSYFVCYLHLNWLSSPVSCSLRQFGRSLRLLGRHKPVSLTFGWDAQLSGRYIASKWTSIIHIVGSLWLSDVSPRTKALCSDTDRDEIYLGREQTFLVESNPDYMRNTKPLMA